MRAVDAVAIEVEMLPKLRVRGYEVRSAGVSWPARVTLAWRGLVEVCRKEYLGFRHQHQILTLGRRYGEWETGAED